MAGWEDLFKGMDQSRVKSAMARAKALSENPTVQQAFSRMDQKEIMDAIRSLSSEDKNRLLKTLFQSKNRDFLKVIEQMK